MGWAPRSLLSYPFTSINTEHLLNITEIKKDVQKNFSWPLSLPQEITSTKQTNPGQDLNWLLRCYSTKLSEYVSCEIPHLYKIQLCTNKNFTEAEIQIKVIMMNWKQHN